MSDFIVSIENALASIAEKYTPEGSQPKVVVHQWIHAIANDTDFYGMNFLRE